MKNLVILITFSLLSCSAVELDLPQLQNDEFFLEVDYAKSIAEVIDGCGFGYIDSRINGNYAYSDQNQGKETVIAAVIMFNKKVSSIEANTLLEKDGRYRAANISELLALSLKFDHPYFNSYIRSPEIIDIGNGLSILNYNIDQEWTNKVNSVVVALGSGFYDQKSLPGWSPWMTAYIYDRDIRTLELKQEFPHGEIKNDTRYYSTDTFLVIRK